MFGLSMSSNVNEVNQGSKDFTRTKKHKKASNVLKAPKAQRRNQAKAQNTTSKQ